MLAAEQVAKTLFASAGRAPTAIVAPAAPRFEVYPELSAVLPHLRPTGKAGKRRLKGDFSTALGLVSGFDFGGNVQWLNLNFMIGEHEDEAFITSVEAIAKESGCSFRGSLRLSRFRTDIRGNENSPMALVRPVFASSSASSGDLCEVAGYEALPKHEALTVGSLVKVNCSGFQFYEKEGTNHMSLEMDNVVTVVRLSRKRKAPSAPLKLPNYFDSTDIDTTDINISPLCSK